MKIKSKYTESYADNFTQEQKDLVRQLFDALAASHGAKFRNNLKNNANQDQSKQRPYDFKCSLLDLISTYDQAHVIDAIDNICSNPDSFPTLGAIIGETVAIKKLRDASARNQATLDACRKQDIPKDQAEIMREKINEVAKALKSGRKASNKANLSDHQTGFNAVIEQTRASESLAKKIERALRYELAIFPYNCNKNMQLTKLYVMRLHCETDREKVIKYIESVVNQLEPEIKQQWQLVKANPQFDQKFTYRIENKVDFNPATE